MKLKRWHPELILLAVLTAFTRFWGLFKPNEVVFDETYFKDFAAHYLDGKFFFDIHPPLGKLLLAGYAHVIGLAPQSMLDGTAVALRVLPALAGALLVLVVWGVLRQFGVSRPFAFLGGLLILLDNALLVESRFILMDTMLLLFGLSALYFYLKARGTQSHAHWAWFTLASLCAGAAASIKWTGLGALGLIGLVWLWDQRGRSAAWRKRAGELALLAIIPALIYMGSFWAHFHLLQYAGGEDDAFMSGRFQATLIDSQYYDKTVRMSFVDKFIELNTAMYNANKTLTATHPYSSQWYTWPLELRSIYYWEGDQDDDGRSGNIYLLGNPVIWWGIWIAIAMGLIHLSKTKRKLRPATISALAITGCAYLINLLPFVAVSRVMFLYHYFFSFCFSLLFAVILWNDLATDSKNSQLYQTHHRRIYVAVIGIIVLGFLYFAPLSYGSNLTPQGLQNRMWLQSWR